MEGSHSGLSLLLINFSVIAAYLVLNSSLNIIMRYTLGIYGFSFPLFLTVGHMLFSFTMLAPLMAFEPFLSKHRATLHKQWKGLVAIGAFMAFNIALNNLSLVEITLSLNQVIRSSIPVVTALLAVAVENKVPSNFEAAALGILVSGVMVTVWEGASGSIKGIALCMAGTVCNAAMMTTSGRVLSEKLDVLRLTFYTAPISCACLLPVYLWQEADRLREYTLEHNDGMFQLLLLLGCVNALTYNIVHYLMIQRTSAVTTTVLGEIKIIGLLVLSALLLGESSQMTPRMMVGCGAAIFGFCLYSHAKLMAARAAAAAAPATAHAPAASEAEAPLLTKGPILHMQQSGSKAYMPGTGGAAGAKKSELPVSRSGSSSSLIEAYRGVRAC